MNVCNLYPGLSYRCALVALKVVKSIKCLLCGHEGVCAPVAPVDEWHHLMTDMILPHRW